MIRRASEWPQQPSNYDDGVAPDQPFTPGTPFSLRRSLPATPANHRSQPGRGRRSQTTATHQGGHFIRATTPQGSVRDVAVNATLQAAALRLGKDTDEKEGKVEIFASANEAPPPRTPTSPLITPADLRVKIRRTRTGNLILFVVDASGSMGARKRMVAVKEAILSLLLDAYQKRDRVGLITFRGQGAKLLVSPTNSVELAERHLRQLPTGGRTPLAAGLHLADQVLTNYLQRDAALAPLLVLVTDGRANTHGSAQLGKVAFALSQKHISALVLDSEQGYVRLGLAQKLATQLDAEYLPLDELRTETITKRVRQKLEKA